MQNWPSRARVPRQRRPPSLPPSSLPLSLLPSVRSVQAPAAGQEEAEEQERLDAPKVVQELQRWSGIATWCSVPGPELSPAPPEICFTKHRKSTEVRPEKFSLECSTILVVVLREKWARGEQLIVSYSIQGDILVNSDCTSPKTPLSSWLAHSAQREEGTQFPVMIATMFVPRTVCCIRFNSWHLSESWRAQTGLLVHHPPTCQYRGTSSVRLGPEELKNNLLTSLLLNPLS